jgi:hypothetical protein
MALSVSDLIDLAILEDADADEHLKTVLTWRYEHMLTMAKALAGAGSAVILATLLPIVQPDKNAPILFETWVWIAGGAAVAIAIGATFFLLARRSFREYVAAQRLLHELREVRPFLLRYANES